MCQISQARRAFRSVVMYARDATSGRCLRALRGKSYRDTFRRGQRQYLGELKGSDHHLRRVGDSRAVLAQALLSRVYRVKGVRALDGAGGIYFAVLNDGSGEAGRGCDRAVRGFCDGLFFDEARLRQIVSSRLLYAFAGVCDVLLLYCQSAEAFHLPRPDDFNVRDNPARY